MFFFDKNRVKLFRRDGHSWETKKNGNANEAHEKLKVEGKVLRLLERIEK